jgi:peptidase M28-like protein
MINVRHSSRVLPLILLLVLTPVESFAQRRARTTTSQRQLRVLERNIRAQLGFLASDAMQGRGSGTAYERIAAEYIGSQFKQFGLQPAGDIDYSGVPGFVQKAVLEATKFSAPPTLTADAGGQISKWEFGRDFLISSPRASQVGGDLQVIEIDGVPAKGAFVLVKMVTGTDAGKVRKLLRKARTAQSAGLIFLETEANKKTRTSGTVNNLPMLPSSISSTASGRGRFVAIALSKEAHTQLSGMSPGTHITFAGPTESTNTGTTWNAVGVLRGSDRNASREAIMLSAHLDHLGVSNNTDGDNIFNGADDDASGCVAVMELARALATGHRPRRTIYFVCFGSEELGGFGAQYFTAHSPVPLNEIVCDITFEMLGRPDSKVKPNTLWLTGFELSDLGPQLAKHGASLVADPRPEQHFFQRSDNYTLAVRGVVAHTVSSFGLHSDYHRPSDELSKIDFPFMTRSIASMITPIRWLAQSTFRPSWLPGKAPTS